MKKKTIIRLAVVFGIMIAFFIFFRYASELGSWRGTSLNKYLKRAYIGGLQIRSLPKGAKDFKFQCYNYGLAAYSYAGFTLSGTDYDDFVAYVAGYDEPSDDAKEKYMGKKVSDTYNYYESGDRYVGFPKRKVPYTAEGDLADYTILYYDSYYGSNMRLSAILVKPETGRFVIVYGGSN